MTQIDETENAPRALQAIDSTRCAEHFAACVAFAKAQGKWEGNQGLRAQLEHLARIGTRGGDKPGGVVTLYKDFAPYSFGFTAGGMNGGLIFHGSHDGGGNGGGPTFSVCLTPCDGWSIHT